MPTPATPSPLALEMKNTLNELKEAHKNFAPKSEVAALQAKYGKLQSQLDALDVSLATRHTSGDFGVSLSDHLKNNESVQRLLKDRRGRALITLSGGELASLQRKSIISATAAGVSEGDPLNPVGIQSTGVLQLDRIPGIVSEARQTLKIRDCLVARPTSLAEIDYVKVTNPMSPGQMVVEASVKPENQVSFTSFAEKVRLIATTIPSTKQVLADFQELESFIRSSVGYYINLEEETQLLAGDSTGENLHGLLPQAMAFNPALLPAVQGWNYIDCIGTAIQQINAAKEIDPTFCVLNTNDWWTIRLVKDSLGRYLLGDPGMVARPSLFGLNIVSTTSITQGTFLVGSGNEAACQIRDRMELVIECSTEHADFWTRNLCMWRAEKRLALVTLRPNSFVSGSFSRSPV